MGNDTKQHELAKGRRLGKSRPGRHRAPARRSGKATSYERSRTVGQQTPAESMSTRDRILEAARQHFADFGLAHASVRAITRLAGVNSALVRYYFGSKRTLYEEVVHHIAKRLIDVRLQSLQQLKTEYGDKPIPLEKLLWSYAEPLFPRPVADLSQDASIYLRFFGRLYTEPSDDLRAILQSQFTDLQRLYIAEINRAVPAVPHTSIIFRFGLLIGALAFLGSKLGVINLLSQGGIDENDSRLSLTEFTTAYAAVFRAPPHGQDGMTNGLPEDLE